MKAGLAQEVIEAAITNYLLEEFPGVYDDVLEHMEEFQLSLEEDWMELMSRINKGGPIGHLFL